MGEPFELESTATTKGAPAALVLERRSFCCQRKVWNNRTDTDSDLDKKNSILDTYSDRRAHGTQKPVHLEKR